MAAGSSSSHCPKTPLAVVLIHQYEWLTHTYFPINLWEKVEEKLQQLEKDDIIENVDGPTPWVSQPVFPPKSSDPTDIRMYMCVDMRSANKVIPPHNSNYQRNRE